MDFSIALFDYGGHGALFVSKRLSVYVAGRLLPFLGLVASMISGVSRLVTPRHSSNLAIFSSKSFCSAFNFFASLKFSA